MLVIMDMGKGKLIQKLYLMLMRMLHQMQMLMLMPTMAIIDMATGHMGTLHMAMDMDLVIYMGILMAILTDTTMVMDMVMACMDTMVTMEREKLKLTRKLYRMQKQMLMLMQMLMQMLMPIMDIMAMATLLTTMATGTMATLHMAMDMVWDTCMDMAILTDTTMAMVMAMACMATMVTMEKDLLENSELS